MIKNIKINILMNKKKYFFGLILFIYSAFLIWYSFNDISIWWDEAVYIGMGKYLATSGQIGMWELFRPPLFPIMYAFLFKLNLPLIIFGKIIVIFSSVGSVWLAYRLADDIRKGAGIFAGVILMTTPIFFSFSRVPMTDVISIFFVLLSLFLFSKNRYYQTGLVVATAFLFRFPQGLILLPIGLSLLYNNFEQNLKQWISIVVIIVFKISLGFFTIVIPYLIVNYLLYGSIFKPFILASQAVSLSSVWYDYGLLFYIDKLSKIAPLLFLASFSPFLFIKYYSSIIKKERQNFILILIVAIILTFYYFWQVHKEVRYSLGFIPYLAILGGITVGYLNSYFNRFKIVYILFFIIVIFLINKNADYYKDQAGYQFVPFHNHLETLNGTFLSTSPLLAVFGQVKIISLFERFKGFENLMKDNRQFVDGIFIKDCDIFCSDKVEGQLCLNELDQIYQRIKDESFEKTYQEKINECTYSIYNK